MTFQDFGLSDELLRAIAEEGYTEPTQVQQQAIPIVLSGHDMLVGSQTGTGKTAGFTLPLLHLLNKRSKVRGQQYVRALILTPTRELAAQVGESVATYGKFLSLRSAIVYGGMSMNTQIRALRKGVDILIATPGRLLDHVSQGNVDLSKVEIVVLDEADRMLDMGFIHDIRKILSLMPKERQSLLFSATFSDEIKRLADGFLKSPKMIEATQRNSHAPKITQVVHLVDKNRKRDLLTSIINTKNLRQVLVFARTKHGANRLSEQLSQDGITSAAIHGNKTQAARTKALADFKKGIVRVLVATDIAARGLDIDQLPHVVNYELPNVPEDYVHRIGRTGRAGSEGEALSLVCIDEHQLLRDIERFLKTPLTREVVPGFEPDPSIRPEPIFKRRGGGGFQRNNRSGNGGNGSRKESQQQRRGGNFRKRSP